MDFDPDAYLAANSGGAAIATEEFDPDEYLKQAAPAGSAQTKNPYETRLAPEEEARFQQWKASVAPNDSGFDYDFRGAFKAGIRPDPQTGHWSDAYKKPNHPTFSDESIYAKDAPERAGHWANGVFVPPAFDPDAYLAGTAPPAFNPEGPGMPGRPFDLNDYLKPPAFDPDAYLQEAARQKKQEERAPIVDALSKAFTRSDPLSRALGVAGRPTLEGLAVKALLTRGGRPADVALNVLTPLAGMTAGTLVEPGGGTAVGGAAGGLAGESLVQARRYFRGETDKPSVGALIAAGAASAIPVGGPLLKTPARIVATRGLQALGIGLSADLFRQLYDTGKIDWGQLAQSGGWSALFGASFGGGEAIATRRAVLGMVRQTPEFRNFQGNDAELVQAVRTKLANEAPSRPAPRPVEPVAPIETPTAALAAETTIVPGAAETVPSESIIPRLGPAEGRSAAQSPESVARPAEAPTVAGPRPLPPDWQVSVQAATGTSPAWVQIDRIEGGRRLGSFAPGDLRAQGFEVPDFSGLPQGSYKMNDATAALAPQIAGPPPAPGIEKQTPVQPEMAAPAPAGDAVSAGSAAAPAAGGQAEQTMPAPPTTVKPQGRRPLVGVGPNGEPDLLSDIAAHVGTLRTAARPGTSKYAGEYDDIAPALATGAARLLRGKDGMAPGQAIEILNATGAYNFQSIPEFAAAIIRTSEQRRVMGRALALESYRGKVEDAALGNTGRRSTLKAPGPVPIEELGLGATFKIRGEKFSVVDIDEGPHGEEVYIVQDGHKMIVPAGTPFYPDKGQFTALPKEPSTGPDPFAEQTPATGAMQGTGQTESHAMGTSAVRQGLRPGVPPSQSFAPAPPVQPPGALVQQLKSLQAVAAPQTMDNVGRHVANLLRELNASKANVEARAEYALRSFRADFTRTPVLGDWKYSSAQPLPRNYAVIDAYESGNTSALAPKDRAFAQEIARQNTDTLARVHALGRGALEHFYKDYFPHLWKDPAGARNVILSSLARRPLEGAKSFLKQRTYQLFREGLEAGLVPATDNPADMWLAKKAEVEKFILGATFQNTGRAEGWIKFKYFAEKPEPGWVTPRDPAFVQWGPPTVKIQEAFDAGMRAKTLEALEQLGIPHERLARLGGQRWGFETNVRGQPGTERITTKFGGPDFAIWHELGHALDSRYPGLREVLFGGTPEEIAAARAARSFKRVPTARQEDLLRRDDELRALADARTEGVQTGPSFEKYVRRTPEKMAAVLQAYLHAPELMRQKAPTVQTAMRGFIAAHPELSVIEDIRPTMALESGETEVPIGGLVKLGDWVMPEAAAKVVDNFLSPGLSPHLWYQAARATSNLLNAAQLSMSAFHLGFTTLDAAVSRLELGITAAAHGDLTTAARTLASLPISPATTLARGIRTWHAVMESTNPEVTKALEEAGGRTGVQKFWVTNFDARMRRAFYEMRAQIQQGQWLQGTSSGLKAAVNAAFWPLEKQMALIHWVVTRQKLGVFMEMAAQDLARLGPQASDAARRETLRLAWDSVDNRMGRVVYDNFFFNRTLKDVSLLAFRAFGWQLGKYAEAGGGVANTVNYLRQWGRRFAGGKTAEPEWTHKMGYLLALPIMVGTVGGIVCYLMTGRRPQNARDCFQPPTGETDANGNPVRLNLPSYVKDAIAYGRHPVTSFMHSLNPALSAGWDLLQNKDFYNVEVRHPDDPLWRQGTDVAKWAAGEMVPFSVSGSAQLRKDATPMWKQIAPFFGVTPVPIRDRMTPAQELASELMSASLPDEPMTREQFDRSRALKDIVKQIKAGPQQARQGLAALRDGVDKGTLNPNAAALLVDRLKFTPLQFQVYHLTVPAALKVWDVANPDERRQIGGLILHKITSSKSLTRVEQAAAFRRLGLTPELVKMAIGAADSFRAK